jgi:hypothetical protein
MEMMMKQFIASMSKEEKQKIIQQFLSSMSEGEKVEMMKLVIFFEAFEVWAVEKSS